MTRRMVLAVLCAAVLGAFNTWAGLLAAANSLDPGNGLMPAASILATPTRTSSRVTPTPQPRAGARSAGDATYQTYLPYVASNTPVYSGPVVFSDDLATVTITHSGTTWTIVRPTKPQSTFTPSSGKTLWVAVTGSDSNAGTSASPFLTIGQAVRSAATGDVIYVRTGYYTETVQISTIGNIVLSAAPGEVGRVHLTPPVADAANGNGVVTILNVKNVVINGLVIEGYRDSAGDQDGHYAQNGITFLNGGTGTVSNNVIYHAVHCGIKEVTKDGSGIVISGNIIFDNGTTLHQDHGIYAPMDDAAIIGNVVFNNAGYGIQSYAGEPPTAGQPPHPFNQTIEFNVGWGNASGGLVIAGTNTKVYHNTFVYNTSASSQYAVGIMYYGDRGSDVRNNIFAFNEVNGSYREFSDSSYQSSGMTDDYNLYYAWNQGYDPSPKITLGTHEVKSDPKFVNHAIYDFRLGSGSPAVGTGVELGWGTNIGAFP